MPDGDDCRIGDAECEIYKWTGHKVHSIIASLVEGPLTGTERRLSTLLGLVVIDLRGLEVIGWGFYAHLPL